MAAVLADAYAAMASAHDEVTALRSDVLPGSQQTFDAVSEGYRLGRFGYLDVLDAQRTLIGAGSQYLRALSDYYKAVAHVERLIGAPLAERVDPPTTPRE
jgi:outer membrane protein, heavy metal efflux system